MYLVIRVLLEKVNSPICKPTPSGAAARPKRKSSRLVAAEAMASIPQVDGQKQDLASKGPIGKRFPRGAASSIGSRGRARSQQCLVLPASDRRSFYLQPLCPPTLRTACICKKRRSKTRVRQMRFRTATALRQPHLGMPSCRPLVKSWPCPPRRARRPPARRQTTTIDMEALCC
ncbi:hypothetical protein GQ607_002668 [Colletotrichum asianum]|uniref:Uncharacterized protein n=1 Tax=Colletotrichum asianum TaxID=702518 RepID=A0A8H3WQ16_9PEZI|nr:hypothetical protein GQ607_002668 [Colletotrichum asianum]